MEWWQIITPLVVTLIAGLICLKQGIVVGHRFALLDMPGKHKRHKRPVPILGGAGLLVSVWLGVGVLALLPVALPPEFWTAIPYVFAGALVLFTVGLSDDLKPVSPWVKLLAQMAAGVILYLGGLKIDPISIPFAGSIEIGWPSLFVTLLWVIGLTNAVNLIDGLDGLAAGVSLIGAATMIMIGLLYDIPTVVLFSSLLVGFLAVFLFYNRYPARIFLGDSGSLQLGYYFAVMSLLVPLKSYTAAALYLPLLALAVPIMEAATSVFRRLFSGQSVMKADRRHIFHYLALAGVSPRRVVLMFYGLAVFFSFFTLAMYFWNRRIVFGLLVFFMVVISATFYILLSSFSRRNRERKGLTRADKDTPASDKHD